MFGATKIRPKRGGQPKRLPRPRVLSDKGEPVSFVRWVLGREGWRFEVVSGRYLGVRDGVRLVDVGGLVVHCPPDEWQEFRP